LHAARRVALWREYLCLHKVVLAVARRDELCQRFMGILGVGPIGHEILELAGGRARNFGKIAERHPKRMAKLVPHPEAQ